VLRCSLSMLAVHHVNLSQQVRRKSRKAVVAEKAAELLASDEGPPLVVAADAVAWRSAGGRGRGVTGEKQASAVW